MKRWPKGTGEAEARSLRVDPDIPIGLVLGGKYRVEQYIGSGAMGSVFRARHTRLPRAYAIKFLHQWLVSDDSLLKRFEREAELAARLSHPNVISVVDIGEVDGVTFLVMDLGAGPTLGQLLANARFEPLRACRLIQQLCDGLAHAHDHGLIHRDLKPDNIVVESRNGDEVPRIADFGLAILRDATEPHTRLTARGMVLGTPHYMAPEMATGHAYDHRVDLFALGVICYELLTGRLPFDGRSGDVAQAYIHDEIPSMAARVPEVLVDPMLETFTRRLLAKRPDDRPATAVRARDNVDYIVGALAGRPTQPMAYAQVVSQTAQDNQRTAKTVAMTRLRKPDDSID
ncbi:MAG: serine/threonine protein kinase [Kofleriaceae bacterium]|nr:serine/threonine protein kinase [Kofleriaceae bacterium]